MSTPAIALAGRPSLASAARVPVLLPKLRDPRLHLAAVIISLQVLGQVAFDFDLSIAQILISLGTCAVLEVGDRLPAPARADVAGERDADRQRGRVHPPRSRDGARRLVEPARLVDLRRDGRRVAALEVRDQDRREARLQPVEHRARLCFLLLGRGAREPLDFWWGPMSPWMALALAIIVGGGLAILRRLHLLVIAIAFWLTFAAAIGVLAVTGHAMTASWHVGPITGAYFWWVLVTSPEILVFLFFMITDPKTIPSGRAAACVYAAAIALLAALLIAPAQDGVLGQGRGARLARDRLRRAALARARRRRSASSRGGSRRRRGVARRLHGRRGVAGIRARPERPWRRSRDTADCRRSRSSRRRAWSRARPEDRAPDRRRSGRQPARPGGGAAAADRRRSRAAAIGDELLAADEADPQRLGRPIEVGRLRGSSECGSGSSAGDGQGPPIAVVTLDGTRQLTAYKDVPPVVVRRDPAVGSARRSSSRRAARDRSRASARRPREPRHGRRSPRRRFAGVRLTDVAQQVGLDFRQGAFRFGVSNDTPAMMGGGLCWLDYDGDGWLDLFVVNTYAESDIGAWDRRGGLPRSALFRNVHGRFVNVTARSGAGLAVRGEGCVAADLERRRPHGPLRHDGGGRRAALEQRRRNVHRGRARRRASSRSAGTPAPRSRDVNGDGRPGSVRRRLHGGARRRSRARSGGFPTNHLGVRDLLFLNEGNGPNGARVPRGRRQAGIDPDAVRPLARRGLHRRRTATAGSTSTSRTTRTRTAST